MIPDSTLYDEYIDRPKLTEQKKHIWVYSSSPLKRGRKKKHFSNSMIFAAGWGIHATAIS